LFPGFVPGLVVMFGTHPAIISVALWFSRQARSHPTNPLKHCELPSTVCDEHSLMHGFHQSKPVQNQHHSLLFGPIRDNLFVVVITVLPTRPCLLPGYYL
jgi:hypothetical protein